MKNKTLTEYVPYKVKDLELTEWGKKEIKLANQHNRLQWKCS